MFSRNFVVKYKPIKSNHVLLPESYLKLVSAYVKCIYNFKYFSSQSLFLELRESDFVFQNKRWMSKKPLHGMDTDQLFWIRNQ